MSGGDGAPRRAHAGEHGTHVAERRTSGLAGPGLSPKPGAKQKPRAPRRCRAGDAMPRLSPGTVPFLSV